MTTNNGIVEDFMYPPLLAINSPFLNSANPNLLLHLLFPPFNICLSTPHTHRTQATPISLLNLPSTTQCRTTDLVSRLVGLLVGCVVVVSSLLQRVRLSGPRQLLRPVRRRCLLRCHVLRELLLRHRQHSRARAHQNYTYLQLQQTTVNI